MYDVNKLFRTSPNLTYSSRPLPRAPSASAYVGRQVCISIEHPLNTSRKPPSPLTRSIFPPFKTMRVKTLHPLAPKTFYPPRGEKQIFLYRPPNPPGLPPSTSFPWKLTNQITPPLGVHKAKLHPHPPPHPTRVPIFRLFPHTPIF